MRLRRTALLIGICVLVALAAAVLSQPAERASAHHIAAISLGGQHSCALTTSGGVQCWGRNQFGQLGNGSTTDSSNPVDVVGLESGVVAVGAGAVHTCAVTTEGGVKCWGVNDTGTLGDDGTCGAICSTPVDVVGLGGEAVAVAGGFRHTCALLTSGGVKCWGGFGWGELGNGAAAGISTPVDVLVEPGGAPLTGAVAITSGGGFHTCVLTEEGGVKCWGRNDTGQIGDGTFDSSPCGLSSLPCRTTPADVVGLSSGVVAISAGEAHTCALTTASALKCWGYNDDGKVGDGTSDVHRAAPVDVVGLTSGVAAVEGGGLHTCVLMTAGGVRCWGNNFFGQVNGTEFGADVLEPVDVLVSGGPVAVSAGGYHTCALTYVGGVYCWGGDDFGQSGDTDADGCSDFAEHGSDPTKGGLRENTHYWDFFDTPDATGQRDELISIGDIAAVVARFGSSGASSGDPLAAPPPAPAYHAAFDRGGIVGPYPWNLAPADGVIVIGDVTGVVAQFGHSCA